MVSFTPVGRMGNFLYECAASLSYALKHDLDFTVPFQTTNEFWSPIYLKHLQNKNYRPSNTNICLYENGHNYQELKFDESYRNQNIIIEGYRQSYKYFDENRGLILRLFEFPYEFKKGWCSVHVRHGDYLNLPKLHPVVTTDYLYKAIGTIVQETGVTNFIVFSDGMKWCKDFFSIIPNLHFEYSEGKSEVEDMILGSHCEHNIVSNSTFSVWQAELNQNQNKVIVIPSEENWFGINNKHLVAHDIYRPEWVQIPYTPIYELQQKEQLIYQ